MNTDIIKKKRNTKKNIVFDKAYFAKVQRNYQERQRPFFWIEIDNKIYVFKKKQLNKVLPQYVDNLIDPIILY